MATLSDQITGNKSFSDKVIEAMKSGAKETPDFILAALRKGETKLGSDQIMALARAAEDHMANLSPFNKKDDGKSFGDRYSEHLTEQKAMTKWVTENHPRAAATGDVLGTAASLLPAGRLASMATTASKLGPAASLATRATMSGAAGAESAGLGSEYMPGTPAHQLDMELGAGAGVLGEVIPPAVGNVLKKAAGVNSEKIIAARMASANAARAEQAAAQAKLSHGAAEQAASDAERLANAQELPTAETEMSAIDTQNAASTARTAANEAKAHAGEAAQHAVNTRETAGLAGKEAESRIKELGIQTLLGEMIAQHAQNIPFASNAVRAAYVTNMAGKLMAPVIKENIGKPGFEAAAAGGKETFKAWLVANSANPLTTELFGTEDAQNQISKAKDQTSNIPTEIQDSSGWQTLDGQPASPVQTAPQSPPPEIEDSSGWQLPK